tara:strand:- start:290 stop:484 length:195 start_codon:yes stop_codon:yes gene_type:complete
LLLVSVVLTLRSVVLTLIETLGFAVVDKKDRKIFFNPSAESITSNLLLLTCQTTPELSGEKKYE